MEGNMNKEGIYIIDSKGDSTYFLHPIQDLEKFKYNIVIQFIMLRETKH